MNAVGVDALGEYDLFDDAETWVPPLATALTESQTYDSNDGAEAAAVVAEALRLLESWRCCSLCPSDSELDAMTEEQEAWFAGIDPEMTDEEEARFAGIEPEMTVEEEAAWAGVPLPAPFPATFALPLPVVVPRERRGRRMRRARRRRTPRRPRAPDRPGRPDDPDPLAALEAAA